jgi:ABC-type amino acid transport substrate-binding protein
LGPGVGFGIRKDDTALLAKVNKGIQDLANDGTYDKITATWKLQGLVETPKKK